MWWMEVDLWLIVVFDVIGNNSCIFKFKLRFVFLNYIE